MTSIIIAQAAVLEESGESKGAAKGKSLVCPRYSEVELRGQLNDALFSRAVVFPEVAAQDLGRSRRARLFVIMQLAEIGHVQNGRAGGAGRGRQVGRSVIAAELRVVETR